ncbi:hypothetical protein J4573_22585 [Actinomadura barringtoniae]|uniref:PA domain-containing protein n=1 Tax=Actinomadura barringtoniae TaxID=1427535 RepID=A0A939PBS1_9ACTN|nr:PA domain-containing protein [Actinomadura barringtoniae]MBO2449907.1 hypothetical protein [Actinomadura barringtoniae]
MRRTPLPHIAATAALTLVVTALAATPGHAAAPATATWDSPTPTTVTLPTGDKVTVASGADGTQVSEVQAAPRKNGAPPAFLTTGRAGNLYVVPEDSLAGLTDMEAFNVTRLARGEKAPRSARTATEDPGAGAVDLHVKAIDRFGRPARGIVRVFDVQNGTLDAGRMLPGDPAKPCGDRTSSCVSVPPGTYSVMGFVYTMPLSQDGTADGTPLNRSIVGDPEVTITKDTEIVLDARKAKEVTVSTPDHETKANTGGLSHIKWYRAPAHGTGVWQGFLVGGHQMEERAYMQPTRPVRTGSFEAYTRWRLEAPAITLRARGHGNVRLDAGYYSPEFFSDVSAEFPRFDGKASLSLVDAGDGSAQGLAGRDLRGKLALIRRSDQIPVAQQANAAAAAGARIVAVYNDTPGLYTDAEYGTRLNVPTVHLPHEQGVGLLKLLAKGRVTIDARGVTASPYLYDLIFPEKGRIPSDLHYTVRDRRLAQIQAGYHGQPGVDLTAQTMRFHLRPWEDVALATMHPLIGAPRARTEYVTPDPDTRWDSAMIAPESPYNHQWPRPDTPRMVLDAPHTDVRPGGRTEMDWLKAPVAPGLNPKSPTYREGDVIALRTKGFTDAAGNSADAYTSMFANGLSTDFRVYRDDQLIAQTRYLPRGQVAVPAEDAAFRIEQDVDNSAAWAKLSTRTKAVWTFRSARPAEDRRAVLPLPLIGVDAPLDLQNRLRGRTVTLTAGHQQGSPQIPSRTMTLAVSYDDGATWRDVQVRKGHGDSYTARLDPPKGAEAVSLRAHVEDTQGNTFSEEIIRALATARA